MSIYDFYGKKIKFLDIALMGGIQRHPK